MTRPLTPRGGNDRTYTPPDLAAAIVRHFQPDALDSVLEPCAGPIGKQAFVDALRDYDLAWFEIEEGSDFLAQQGASYRYDWVITNPPWSLLLAFLVKSMSVANNVVFLCLVPAFFQKAKQRAIRESGFGMREILFVPEPPRPWPHTGFCLGAVYVQRGYAGPITHSHLAE